MPETPNKAKNIEKKISPYLNNYGQIIVNEKIDEDKLKKYSKKLNEFLKKNANKYDDEFKNIILKDNLQSEFNYIELFRALKMNDIEKSINFLEFRYRFGLSSKKKVNLDYPPYLLIEPVSACNFRCPMCFQIDRSFTKKPFMGVMDWNLFKKIVDEANEIGTGAITLASRGEPTMHPKLGEMLKYISTKKNIFEIKLNSNGSFLTEKICNEIFDANLNTIVISADHYEKKQFEKLRKNSIFEKIIENVKMLYEVRNSNFPNSMTEIRVSGVDYYKNLDREKFREFWKPICDNVSVASAVERWDTYNNEPEKNNLSACSFLWDRMYVWFDGKCNPCDADYKSYLSYGDVSKNSIKEVWNGDKINNLRKLHLENKRNQVNPCDRCGMMFN